MGIGGVEVGLEVIKAMKVVFARRLVSRPGGFLDTSRAPPFSIPAGTGTNYRWCSSTQQWHEVYGKWRSRPFDLVKLKSTLSKWQYALANDGWNSLFWGNHDLQRAVSKYGDVKGYPVESAKMVHQVRRSSSILYSDERRLQWAHCGGKLPEEETQEHYLLVLTPRTSRNV